MKHIFLSYSRKDIEIMRRVREDLSAAGLKVWTDEKLEPGTPSWRKAIESAIEKAGCFVVILSPDAKQSEWVDRELGYATACGLRIIPVLVRGDERSAVPLELINMQRIDIRSDYASVADQLIPTLNTHLGVKPKPRSGQRRPAEPASQPAPKASVTKPKAKTRRPSSPIAGQPSAEELAEIFGFTMDELLLNRNMDISKRQRSSILSNFWTGCVIELILLFTTLLIHNEILRAVLFVMLCIIGLIIASNLYAYLFPRVKSITGTVKRTGSKRNPKLQVRDQSLILNIKDRDLVSETYEGRYRAFYATSSYGASILLSIEPWNEEKN